MHTGSWSLAPSWLTTVCSTTGSPALAAPSRRAFRASCCGRGRPVSIHEAGGVIGRRRIEVDQGDQPLSRVTEQVGSVASEPGMTDPSQEAATWDGSSTATVGRRSGAKPTTKSSRMPRITQKQALVDRGARTGAGPCREGVVGTPCDFASDQALSDRERVTVERRTGVEPASTPWKGVALPLSYRRTEKAATGGGPAPVTVCADDIALRHLGEEGRQRAVSKPLAIENSLSPRWSNSRTRTSSSPQSTHGCERRYSTIITMRCSPMRRRRAVALST